MKKCTICGKPVDLLNYGGLKLHSITRMEILGEHVKNKETILNLVLCSKCRTEIAGEITEKVLNQKKEIGCNHDCANCDGARI